MSAEGRTLTGRLREALGGHHLGGDTARITDSAGLCLCGERFYEYGNDAPGYLAAHQRMVARHTAHLADVTARVVEAWLRDELTQVGAQIGSYRKAQTAIADLDRDHIDVLAVGSILSALRDEVHGATVAALVAGIGVEA